jgi:tetratricopeptide (TPR) repeat protein
MCGGSLEIENGQSVGTCDSCGSTMTLPKLDDDRRANLYDRANHFRRNNEYDKAAALFESILNEDKTDAEVYWSLILCKYGIEYVEDPKTHKRVPTCNRTQLTSIFADEDYKSAVANADGYQKNIYEEEAKAIDAIQKGILEVSQKEAPFDIFICYKETDNNSRRTLDSVLANDLYHQLTQEGFKVFFSRITLEDKIGIAYEPYIFAALQSAKVMVVLGTKRENLESVWVKNEWSRFLALIKDGAKKTLIPAYRDMDPYDLPEEFSHLQAQDMGKLGFMQDLIRGIKKLTESPSTQAAPAYAPPVASNPAESLVKRAFLFLEDADWKKANDLLEQGLNLDPENAQAYVGKLMADLQVKKEEELALCNKRISGAGNFQKAIRFADENYRKVLEGYNQIIVDRLEYAREEKENAKKEKVYNAANSEMDNAANSEMSEARGARAALKERVFLKAAEAFESIKGYKNADELAVTCRSKAEESRFEMERAIEENKRQCYSEALSKGEKARKSIDLTAVSNMFKELGAYQDSVTQSERFKLLAKQAKKKQIAYATILWVILATLVLPATYFARSKLAEFSTSYTVVSTRSESGGPIKDGSATRVTISSTEEVSIDNVPQIANLQVSATKASSPLPFDGWFDPQFDGVPVLRNAVAVIGWAVYGAENDVEIFVDGQSIGLAERFARKDVLSATKSTGRDYSKSTPLPGFKIVWDTRSLENGRHLLTFKIKGKNGLTSDNNLYTGASRDRWVVVDNASFLETNNSVKYPSAPAGETARETTRDETLQSALPEVSSNLSMPAAPPNLPKEDSASPSKWGYINGDNVYLRPTPKKEGGKIFFQKNDEVKILEYQVVGGEPWLLVDAKGERGWIHSELVERTQSAARPSTAPQPSPQINAKKPNADILVAQGMNFWKQKRYKDAYDKFEAAYKLNKTSKIRQLRDKALANVRAEEKAKQKVNQGKQGRPSAQEENKIIGTYYLRKSVYKGQEVTIFPNATKLPSGEPVPYFQFKAGGKLLMHFAPAGFINAKYSVNGNRVTISIPNRGGFSVDIVRNEFTLKEGSAMMTFVKR